MAFFKRNKSQSEIDYLKQRISKLETDLKITRSGIEGNNAQYRSIRDWQRYVETDLARFRARHDRTYS